MPPQKQYSKSSPPQGKMPLTTPDWQEAVRRRRHFYLFVAFLLAVLFGALAFRAFGAVTQPEVVAQVVYASHDIPAGTVLTPDMIMIRQVPPDTVPKVHYSLPEQVVGRVTLYPLAANEPILPNKLVGGTGGPLAQRCPMGKWCVRIPEDWFVAAPPELAPGDHVEIASAKEEQPFDAAGFIASDVQVIALPKDSAPSYILAVDAQEALNLLYAHVNQFQLLLLLRPAGQ